MSNKVINTPNQGPIRLEYYGSRTWGISRSAKDGSGADIKLEHHSDDEWHATIEKNAPVAGMRYSALDRTFRPAKTPEEALGSALDQADLPAGFLDIIRG